MGRIKKQSSLPESASDNIPELGRLQNNLAADAKTAHTAADRQAEENEALKQEYEHQLELLRKEREELQFKVQKLQQKLNAVELERDVTTRLLQQQTVRISRLHRELAASNSHAEQLRILPQSTSRHVIALLRTAKNTFTRIVSKKRW